MRRVFQDISSSHICLYGVITLQIYACRQGHSDIIELLLGHGARPDVQTKGGATALHRASYHGHLKCVSLLISKGADCTLVDSDGKTALHKAAENGHEDVCRVLLKKCPDLLAVKDSHGRTALDCALPKHSHLSTVLQCSEHAHQQQTSESKAAAEFSFCAQTSFR